MQHLLFNVLLPDAEMTRKLQERKCELTFYFCAFSVEWVEKCLEMSETKDNLY